MGLKRVENNLVKSLGTIYLTMAEARRVTIAAELGRNPSVLFMDEPFKELDSSSSLHLVQTLKVCSLLLKSALFCRKTIPSSECRR